jgi:cation:H+ antiporter
MIQLLSSPIALICLIAIGCFFLIKGANYLVDNATLIAKYFNVPMIVIGMTVVAFGTSMPEFVVNVIASATGNSTIALTNVYGSNFINILVILGLSAIIFPIKSKPHTTKIDMPIAIVASCVFLMFNLTGGMISRWEGIVLLLMFVGFLFVQYKSAKEELIIDEPYNSEAHLGRWIGMVIVGLCFLTGGGQVVVRCAEKLALTMGISESIIGLTVVSLGTSLPELATSCVAAYKKNPDLAIGNIIGSNIFNILMVIGLSATILPLPVYGGVAFDGILDIIAAILVLVFVLTNKNREIKRWHGITFLLIYGGYLAFRITNL